MTNEESTIREMINRSADAYESADALKFSQAALNSAHAYQILMAMPPTISVENKPVMDSLRG